MLLRSGRELESCGLDMQWVVGALKEWVVCGSDQVVLVCFALGKELDGYSSNALKPHQYPVGVGVSDFAIPFLAYFYLCSHC
jgi:hypothetical protein